MSTEPQEYTDEPTGIRLTVERDNPGGLKLTVFMPENCTLPIEEVGEAVYYLIHRAGIGQLGQAPPQGGKQ